MRLDLILLRTEIGKTILYIICYNIFRSNFVSFTKSVKLF